MNTRTGPFRLPPHWRTLFATLILALCTGGAARADESDEVAYRAGSLQEAEVEAVWLSADELEDLAGPVALYPDDLLAIVLPASTYPLQVVQAARFLEALDSDPSLTPDERWDESIVALLNYPDVVNMMNDDIEWTWALGESVVAQESDLIQAIERFRAQAYEAGNLASDDHQVVDYEDERITITPVEEDVIYVPYYEPRRVIVYQREPVYFYYPHRYPVYYYPYRTRHSFYSDRYWGVTSLFHIGWSTRSLHVRFHHYPSHPYFGRSYLNSLYYHHHYQPRRYRHRAVSSARSYLGSRHDDQRHDRGYRGDRWRPGPRHGARPRLHGGQRTTHTVRRENGVNQSDRLQGDRNNGPRRDGRRTRDGAGRRGLTNTPAGRAPAAPTPAVRTFGDRTTTAATSPARTTATRAMRDSRPNARHGERTRPANGVRRSSEQRTALTEPRAREVDRPRTSRAARSEVQTRRPARREDRVTAPARAATRRVVRTAEPTRTDAGRAQRSEPVQRPRQVRRQETRQRDAAPRRADTRRAQRSREAPVKTRRTERSEQKSRPQRSEQKRRPQRSEQKSRPQRSEKKGEAARSERPAREKSAGNERQKSSAKAKPRGEARRDRRR